MNKVIEALRRGAVIGHRGYPLRRRENTLASFAAAIEAGADIVEMDVRSTKDGVVVVSHDDKIAVAGGYVDIRESRWLDISTIKVGGEPIPRLEDALSLIDGKVGVFIEIKDPADAPLVAELVKSMSAENWVAVISFHEEALMKTRGLAPLGLIYARPPGKIETARRLSCDIVLPHFRLATAKAIAFAHRLGLLVAAWTVNDYDVMRMLWARGVDGIASDDVELAVKSRKNI